MTKRVKLISVFFAIVMLLTSITAPTTAMGAAKKKTVSPSTVYTAVKNAYGKSFPLSSGASTASCASVGVSSKYCSSYYGRTKGSTTKYVLFIAKAKDSSSAKKIKSQLKDYVKNESKSMGNYLTATGKKLYKKAKIGTKKNYVYLVMLDTDANKKAVKAINNELK